MFLNTLSSCCTVSSGGMASQPLFGLSAARASAPSRAPSPSDPGSGMYISGGGGFVSSRSNVGLWLGRGADMSRLFCGGVIGKAGHKMCIVSGCGVAAHVGRKAAFPVEEDVVFIGCMSAAGSGGKTHNLFTWTLGCGRAVWGTTSNDTCRNEGPFSIGRPCSLV